MISFCAATRSSIVPVAAAAAHRLALRERELLLERLHLEKEDVAARLARRACRARRRARARSRTRSRPAARRDPRDRACARPLTGGRAPRDAQRHDRLGAAAHGVDELEALDAEVVLGLGLDVDFLEPRDRAIAGRPQRRGRRADDPRASRMKYSVSPRVRQPFAIGERDAIRAVLDDRQRRRHELSAASRRQARSALPVRRASSGPSPPRRSVCTRRRTSVPAGA